MTISRKMITLAAIGLFAGCGPEIPREELGTIVTEVPSFDPEEQKYPLPRLEAKSGEESPTDATESPPAGDAAEK